MDDTLWWILLGLFLLFFMFGKSRGGEPVAPVAETDLSEAAKARVDEALARGAKIEAIKIVREDTGAGLKAAKLFVDARGGGAKRRGDPIDRG